MCRRQHPINPDQLVLPMGAPQTIACLAAVPGVIAPNYRLSDVAAALGRAVQSLRSLARRGEFPRLFRVSRNDWRVEKDALELWARGVWERDVKLEVRADAVRRSYRQPARMRRRDGGAG